MLVEMADMTKKTPLGIVENILVRIDKFPFPSNFVIIDKTPNETIILGRPFLATIYVEINVFDKEISLGIDNDRVNYDMEKKDHNFTTPIEKIFMIKSDLDNRPQSSTYSNYRSLNSERLRNVRDRSPNKSLHDQGIGLSFPDYLLAKYRKYQDDNLVWDDLICRMERKDICLITSGNPIRMYVKISHIGVMIMGLEEDKRDEMD
ncbi:reverse transcriptase domain-containing protein [Tanacetum coccineum]